MPGPPILSPKERADALVRARERVIKQYDKREHLREEILCREILRDLSHIESVLMKGREIIEMEEGDYAEVLLSRERIASLKIAGDLKWKRLSLALPPLKPTSRKIRTPLELGPLEDAGDRLAALMLISKQYAEGELLEEEATALRGHVEAIHAMATGTMLDDLMDRIDRIEEQSEGNVIQSTRKQMPPEASEAEFADCIPSGWGGDVTDKARSTYTVIEDD